MITDKPIDKVHEEDLKELINSEFKERKSLDYKRELQVNSDSEKKEFLADVSSFANSVGGLLLIGIEELDGVPKKICPLIINSDIEISRLENILRDGIVPRISGLVINPIKTSSPKGLVLGIRIPPGFSGLHMVKYKEHNKFYSRNSNGKYLLDYGEMIASILQTSNMSEQIRNFRIQRLTNIQNGETPFALQAGPKLVIHLIPLYTRKLGKQLDLKKLSSKVYDLETISGHSNFISFNFDGVFVKFQEYQEYTQIFRDGSAEFVTAKLFTQIIENDIVIPITKMEVQIVDTIDYYLQLIKSIFDIEPPICVMLTLMNVNGCRIPKTNEMGILIRNAIQKDIIIIQEVILEENVKIAEKLRSAFDIIYNTAGFDGSPNYDQNGTWTGRKRMNPFGNSNRYY